MLRKLFKTEAKIPPKTNGKLCPKANAKSMKNDVTGFFETAANPIMAARMGDEHGDAKNEKNIPIIKG